MNYFKFFNLPVAFQVDEAALKRAFLFNSKKFHPDFHTLADDAQQAEMLELSTLNNEAYKTLADPDRRMRHVLELKNLLADEGENKLPQDFLMDMMDINEAIMELEFEPDPERLAQVKNEVQQLENQLFESVRPTLENWRDGAGDDAGLRAVRDFFFKKRYLLRVLENLSKFAPGFDGSEF
ncbi:MAG: Fe-S protein assembly co-chaperone HscB [Saprospiraceae bacterium]